MESPITVPGRMENHFENRSYGGEMKASLEPREYMRNLPNGNADPVAITRQCCTPHSRGEQDRLDGHTKLKKSA